MSDQFQKVGSYIHQFVPMSSKWANNLNGKVGFNIFSKPYIPSFVQIILSFEFKNTSFGLMLVDLIDVDLFDSFLRLCLQTSISFKMRGAFAPDYAIVIPKVIWRR